MVYWAKEVEQMNRQQSGRVMNGCSFSNEPGLAERLQRKSREEMKLRLLKDIRVDMAVCEVERLEPGGVY